MANTTLPEQGTLPPYVETRTLPSFVYARGGATKSPPPAPAFDYEDLEIAASPPDFALPGIDGREHTLAEYDNAEVLVLIQAGSSCPYFRAWEGRIKAIHADYTPRNIAIVALNSNVTTLHPEDSLEGMVSRAAKEGFEFDYLRDEDQSVARALGSTTTPEVFVFNRQRKLAYHGMIDDNHDETKVTQDYLRDALDALLEGESPTIAETHPAGCAMKWAFSPPTKVDLSRLKTELDRALESGWPMSLSYIDEDGHPELTFEGSTQVLSSNQLALWAPIPDAELPRGIAKHPEVTLVYFNTRDHRYFSFRGRARLDPSVNDEIFSNLPYYEMTYDPEGRGVAIVIDVDSVRGSHKFGGRDEDGAHRRSGPVYMAG